MGLISKCCQAKPHHLYAEMCSDCKDHAEFIDEDEIAEGPEGKEMEKAYHEIEQARNDTYFRARLAPAIQFLENLIYNSTLAEHGFMESGKLGDLRVQMSRTKALREALSGLRLLTNTSADQSALDLERPY